MKFFLAFGENCCGVGATYSSDKYQAALLDLRSIGLARPTSFASYYIPGIKHMYSQFPDFYQPMSGNVTIAAWTKDFLAGTMKQIGP